MTVTDYELAKVVGRLTAGFDKRLPDDTLAVWREELTPLEFSPAYAAARDIVKHRKYFPTISEFGEEYHRHAARQAPPKQRTECTHCEDGWVLTNEPRNEAEPCRHCRAEQFLLWSRGEIPATKEPPNAGLFVPGAVYERVPEPEWAAKARQLIDAMKAGL